jgi:regulation of enolase protein 1 (concanavalin A-like superfamily)
VIDDFERYTDERGERLYEFWIDGWITGNGSVVGYTETPFYAGYILCHSGLQAMPFNYDNSVPPHYSEAYRAWETPQDWTVGGGTDLSLWVYGWPLPFLEKPNGKIILNGEGVWTTRSEGFLYARKELAGEGSIVARVESLEDTDAWARAGLMIRDTAFWSTKFASVAMTPAHDVAFACSVKSNQDRQETALLNVQPPCWLKLTRTGRTFTAQHSLDGATWQEIRDANGNAVAVEIDMSATVQVGLFVASNKYGVPARAEFSGVAVEGDVSGSWQPEGINARLWRNDPDSLYVAIEDAAGRLATVVHPDPNAVNVAGWTQWRIPLSDFAAAGVDLQIVARMYLGLGDRDNPQPSGAGMIHIDDIAVIKR